ncbi:MAG TPA: serine/threonine-protein kinase [Candidatus Obscuribacterales bacterium]
MEELKRAGSHLQGITVPTAEAQAEMARGGNAIQQELSPGQIINDRYEVVSIIGRGGMGIVYHVRQRLLDKEYALKTLDTSQVTETTWRRFQQEAKAMSKLDHPNLTRVHELDLLDGFQPYFVMDLVPGTNLAKRLKEKGPLSVAEAIPIFVQVCFGLGYAHEKGVIHRDLKPSNIMLIEAAGGPSVKIVDFGIAKLIYADDGDNQGLTRTGEIFGSPLYMSPEQCLGIAVDHRTDIYSLGCLIFEALTGLPPFLGDTALSTMMKHQSEVPSTLKQATLGGDFPPELEALVARLLEKDPPRRYQNLHAVAHDLSKIQRGEEISRNLGLSAARPSPGDKGANIPKAQAIAALVAGCMMTAVCTFLGTFWYCEWHKPERLMDTKMDSQAFSSNQASVESPTAWGLDDKPFSKLSGSRLREFHFPSSSLGTYRFFFGPQMLFQMKGKQFIPLNKGLCVAFNPTVLRDPALLKRFRPDEIVQLEARGLAVNDASLFYLPTLSSIRVLLLRESDVTDEGLQFVERLPKLYFLDLDGAKVSAEGLAKLANLKQLTNLYTSGLTGVAPLLDRLQTAKGLTGFGLCACNLTDDDMRRISRLTSLRDIYLDKSTFSAAGLKNLLKLPNLQSMSLTECALSPDQIAALKEFRKLKSLYLLGNKVAGYEVAELKRALPQCAIVTGEGREDNILDVKTIGAVELEREEKLHARGE